MTRGERSKEGAKLLLIGARARWSESLRGATLANHDARSAFRHPELLLKCNDHLTPAVRGQDFPSATNLNMSMSRPWLATMRLSGVFSFLSSFKRFASFAFKPPY